MGFYSKACRHCGCDILNEYSVTKRTGWMCKVTVITDDARISGTYDGYGRVDGVDISDMIFNDRPADVYHQSCWEDAGRPEEWQGGSDQARYQGYFIPDWYASLDTVSKAIEAFDRHE